MGRVTQRTMLIVLWIVLISGLGTHSNLTAQMLETGRTVSASITVDVVERSYHTYIPQSFASETASLVIALHPSVSSGKAMQALTGLDTLAEAANALVVYPDSAGYFWDDGRSETGMLMPDGPQADLQFIPLLIEQIVADYELDAAPVYIVGFDGGGSFAYRLVCEMPELFKGMVIVTTTMWDYHYEFCPESGQALNVLLLHGGRDAFYPEEGRVISGNSGEFTLSSLEETTDFWMHWNGCEGVPDLYANDRVIAYNNCANETETVVYRMPQAGHHWMRLSGDYRLNQFGMDATQIITDWIMGESDWPETEITNVPLPPLPRTYRLYVPTSYDGSVPLPMIFALHGRPDNGLGMAIITQMNRVAEENGFIAVYPDGINQEWNYVRGVPLLGRSERDDAIFFEDLIADLAVDLNIDTNRVYLTGFSNGGFMTERQICESPDTFAAFAFIGSTLFPGIFDLCEDTPEVPILYMHGSEDVSIPWDGFQQAVPGLPEPIYISYPVPDTVAFWAMHNGCEMNAEYDELPAVGELTGTRVYRTEFGSCTAPLHVYLILAGGHNWPGVPGVINQAVAGRVNTDIHASEEIWAFFSTFSLEPDA